MFAVFRGRKTLSEDKTNLKIVARWRYDLFTNAQQNFQNLRKWVQSLCAKVLQLPFTPYIVDVHPYKNILLLCYKAPQKNCQVRRSSAKNGGQCRHLLCSPERYCPANFKNVLGAFIMDDL